MVACSPSTLSHRVGYGAPWRPITAARCFAATRRCSSRDARAKSSMTKPRAAHPAVGAGATEGVLSRPSLRRMDTWMPPCPAHLLTTDVQTKIPSASPPRQPYHCYPRCALRRASSRSLCRRVELSPPSLPPCAGPHCFYAIYGYKRRPPLHLIRTYTMSASGKPSLPHQPLFSATSSVPSCLTPPLSPYVGPRASAEPRAAPQPEGSAPSPPLSSDTINRAGEFRPSVAYLPRFELGLSTMSGE
jgi:hypothetical protein